MHWQIQLFGRKTTGDPRRQPLATARRDTASGALQTPPTDDGKLLDLGTYDKVVLAEPPVAVRMMRTPVTWSLDKREALRALRFGPIRKIGLMFK